jgi:Dodecin
MHDILYSLLESSLFQYIMTHIAEVIEIVGNSDKSWQDAAQVALDEAKKTVHGITGIEVGLKDNILCQPPIIDADT